MHPFIPIIMSAAGIYAASGEPSVTWEYSYSIDAAGTRSETRVGSLRATVVDLSAAKPGTCLVTPWGPMQLLDTAYENGWLLEHTYGRPLDCSSAPVIPAPNFNEYRRVSWSSSVGAWHYNVEGAQVGTKSERREGVLELDGLVLSGRKIGDRAETPWGVMSWRGPVDPSVSLVWEQGFLLRRAGDGTFDPNEGRLLPISELLPTLDVSSAYMREGCTVGTQDRQVHGLRLIANTAQPGNNTILTGTLILDPNKCSIGPFGDREGCTRMAVQSVPVELSLQRLADPRGLGRMYYSMRGEGLPEKAALVSYPGFTQVTFVSGDVVIPLLAPRGRR
jgi:hypothetical protein